MKRIIKVTYNASEEEIEIVRNFYYLLDLMDKETYEDFNNRVTRDGTYEATEWLLDALEED